MHLDPYVAIEHKGNTYRTTAQQDGGRHPHWSETLEIPMVSLDDQLTVTCYTDDLAKDACAGQATFKASQLADSRAWLPLLFQGKKAAEVLLECKPLNIETPSRNDSFERQLKEYGSPRMDAKMEDAYTCIVKVP